MLFDFRLQTELILIFMNKSNTMKIQATDMKEKE
ncbi:hypothetical protein X279_01655 [Oenococcus oeni IOEB_0501]|nr:hypothetical protein X279_01655 [Oenococcus oeni IOEB_0501]